MAFGGFVLGGLLGGLGKGISMQAEQAREDALERLRAARQIEGEGRAETRMIEAEGRAEERAIAAEGRKEKRDTTAAERLYEQKKGLLGVTAVFDEAKDNRRTARDIALEDRKTANDIRLEGVKASNARSLEKLEQSGRISLEDHKSALDEAKRLREAGTVIERTVVHENGQIFGITADGTSIALQGIKNGKRAPIIEREKSSGGGDEDYLTPRNRPDSSPRRSAPAPAAKAPETIQGKPISPQDVANLYNEATQRAASGDPTYKGLNAAQIKAKVDGLLRQQGYAI